MDLTGSLNCVTRSVERCSEAEGNFFMFWMYTCTHTYKNELLHLASAAPCRCHSLQRFRQQSSVAGCSDTADLPDWSVSLPGCTEICWTYTHTHTQRCCVFSSARWLDTNRMEMWRDSLHDDYVDSVRGHQDDGLPPETCTQTQTQIFINTIFVTMTVSYLANWYPNHSWIVIVSLQSYHMTFSS